MTNAMTTLNADNIRIVLIETSHPGNIGAAARAMKTMGLSKLYLVKPNKFPSSRAVAMASGAIGILDQAVVTESLQDAVKDCHIVVGTSARTQRTIQWPIINARECGTYAVKIAQTQKIALIFGRERTGLSNEELQYCQTLVTVPVNPDFSSLNVAAAVQILSYEIAMANNSYSSATPIEPKKITEEAANAEAMESFYTHLEQTLISIRFLDPENPRLLMRRLRRLYSRTQMNINELNMMRGILSACQGRKFISRKE
jgi:tRNA/rRNA methyltransferase/tRNA (cytidine32/uridine32-2'-O)-methyltransferase